MLFRTAAILHLSHSVPSKLCFTVTDFNSYNTVHTGTITGAEKRGGRMKLSVVMVEAPIRSRMEEKSGSDTASSSSAATTSERNTARWGPNSGKGGG